MAEIVVQGEHYATADDLHNAIVTLEGQLLELPTDTPQAASLAEHIAKLYEALPVAYKPGGSEVEPVETLLGDDETTEEPPETDELQHTLSIIEAAQGAQLHCLLCGQEVPFPENPPLDPDVECCDGCNGWGKTLTGSRVDGHAWRDCPRCQGSGFKPKTGVAAPEGNVIRAAGAPKWDGATWDADNQWWNPPTPDPPWAGAHWDHYAGSWEQ